MLGRIQGEQPPLSVFLEILEHDNTPGTQRYAIKIAIGGLTSWTLSRLDGRAAAAAAGAAGATIARWIPAALVEKYFAGMLNAFHGDQVGNSVSNSRQGLILL